MSEEGGYGDASYLKNAFTNTLNKYPNKDRCGFEGVKGLILCTGCPINREAKLRNIS